MMGPAGISLILSLTNPSPEEIATVRFRQLRCGLAVDQSVSTALLAWRFDGIRPLWMDTPFHICLDPRQECWSLPERQPHEHLLVMIVLQDQFRIVRALRAVTMRPKLMAAIEAVVAAQVEAVRGGHWSRDAYNSDIEALYRRWPTSKEAMRDAIWADLGV